MFPAYIERPKDCRFEGQDPNERVLLLLRAHPITNLPWIFLALAVFFLPFFVHFLTPGIVSLAGLTLNIFLQTFQAILLIINYLLVLVIIYEGFLSWYFNVALISNEKIVSINFENLLYRGVDLAPLPKIEETDSVIAGTIGTIFDFGKVTIQTAGAHVAIEIKNVQKPAVVADIILSMARELREA